MTVETPWFADKWISLLSASPINHQRARALLGATDKQQVAGVGNLPTASTVEDQAWWVQTPPHIQYSDGSTWKDLEKDNLVAAVAMATTSLANAEAALADFINENGPPPYTHQLPHPPMLIQEHARLTRNVAKATEVKAGVEASLAGLGR